MSHLKSIRMAACTACCVLALGAVPVAYAAPTYSITDLGVFGLDNINIGGVNNAGEIVGWGNGNLGYRSFLSDTATHTLGVLSGVNGKATGINDSGWITGFSTIPGNANFRAFLYRNGSAQDTECVNEFATP